MEEVLLRFPHLGENIFKIVSNKKLIQSKMTTRSWSHFIVSKKFYKQRVIYENLQKDVDDNGYTPLHKAARDGDLQKYKLIIVHIENKCPVNKWKNTPLHHAVWYGHFDICKLIIDNVRNKNPANGNENTALRMAAMKGHLDICKLIINNVTNKHPMNKYYETPKDLAEEYGFEKISGLF